MTYQAEVLADTPLDYYRLDLTSGTTDTNLGSQGGSAVATLVNTPLLNQTGLISDGKAVSFRKAESEDLTVSASVLSTNFSFEFWFKWPSGGAGDVLVRDNTTSGGCIIGIDNGGTFAIRWAGTMFNTSLPTSTVRDNATHHLVVDKTGTSMQAYVDGNQVLTTNSASNTASSGVWHFARNGATAVYTDVTFDELAIYPAAIGQARVSAHLAAGAAPQSPPANTVAPAITTDGSPTTGETVSCSTGTWTGAPTSFTYQWKRGGSSIGGATSSSYQLQASDEGLLIKCTVTATNSGGSTAADSNEITPAVTSPLDTSDIELRFSGGASNTDGTASHGGTESSVVADLSLFDPVSYPAAQAGQIDYRLVYVHNTHPVFDAGAIAYVSLQEAAGQSIEIGVATEAAGATVAQTASKLTAPTSVTFSAPVDAGTGINLGTIPHRSMRGLWIKWAINPATPGSVSNPATVAIEVSQQ